MSSQTYRYYRLDGVGYLHLAEWFEAEDDEGAVALIEQMQADGRCEIWQGNRLVAKVSPERLEA
jgi:hypothetical protein